MYEILKKKAKNQRRIYILLYFIVFLVLSFVTIKDISKLNPKPIKYSEFENNINKTVIFKPEFILDYFMEGFEKKGNKEKITETGYIVYDSETGKYFGVVVPQKYIEIFETELENFANDETGDYIQNIPEFKGTIKKMTEEEKKFFSENINDPDFLALELYYNYIEETGIDPSSLTEEEFIAIIDEMYEKVKNNPDSIDLITDFYLIEYNTTNNLITSFILMTILTVIVFLIFLSHFIYSKNYSNMEKFKDLINSRGILEQDLIQDFNISKNFYNIWIGNKFIILLADDNIDFHTLENIAWAFVFKTKARKNKASEFKLFTIDFEGNKKTTAIQKSQYIDILKNIQEKSPNACIGYSQELEMIANQNLEDIKNFDKSTLKPFEIIKLN